VQTDAPSAAGCEKVFVDHASGTLAKRSALEQALGYLRAGDTLVITKLDRLGRSVGNLKALADELQARQVGLRALSQGIDTTTLGGRPFFHMLAAIAEFEHDLILERTVDGLATARARGRMGGPRFKMTPTRSLRPGRCTTPGSTPCSRSPTRSRCLARRSTDTWASAPTAGPER